MNVYLNSETQVMIEELNGIITVEEIQRSANNGQSGGPDNCLNDFFFIHGAVALYLICIVCF